MFHISVNKITVLLWGFLVSISVSNGCKSKIPVILVTVVPGGRSLTSQNTEKSLFGNRRPNVVSLVINNNSSFLARPRPLICHLYATQIWSTSSVDF